MENLSNIAIAKKYMQDKKFRTKKKFGQNFLMDENVLNDIVEASSISEDDIVIEIGPGIGTLSQKILDRAKKAIIIEIDENLIPILNETLQGYDNLKLINKDILDIDLDNLIDKEDSNLNIKIVANLPYYITTPILNKIIKSNLNYKSITVMVQKEVADRMRAFPGNKDYGSLSLLVQFYTEVNIIEYVDAKKFFPVPKVDSAVIDLKKRVTLLPKGLSKEMLFTVIRAAFLQRRKTLYNGLVNCREINLSKDELKSAIKEAGFSDTIRGEKLSLEDFIALSNIIYQKEG